MSVLIKLYLKNTSQIGTKPEYLNWIKLEIRNHLVKFQLHGCNFTAVNFNLKRKVLK